MIDRFSQQGDARLVAVLGSAVLHATVFGLSGAFGPPRTFPIQLPAPVTEIEIETVAPELAPPEPVTVEPVAAPRASRPVRRAPPASRPASPEPAAAAPAPAAAPVAPEMDATASDTVVSGTTATPPNGAAASAGTAQLPGALTASVRASTRSPSAGSDGADRSRAPRLAGTTDWRCPFPIEADGADVDRAVVTLRVEVARDGSVVRTAALEDPGHGFGRQAQRCALRKRWAPGLDRAGKPAPATAIVRVRFER